MKPLPEGARTKNTKGNKETCRWCDDTGYVIYDSGDPHDEEWAKKVRHLTLKERHEQKLYRTNYGEAMAPCPYCEQGWCEEHPKTEKRKGEKAGYEASRITSPWGEDGFWASRDEKELVAAKKTADVLPLEENARRMRELMLRFHDTAMETKKERALSRLGEVENVEGLLRSPPNISQFEPVPPAEEKPDDGLWEARLQAAEESPGNPEDVAVESNEAVAAPADR